MRNATPSVRRGSRNPRATSRPPVRLAALGLALLLAACASAPPLQQAQPGGAAPSPTASTAASPAFSSLVASRSASVVDISTLRIGTDDRAAELEIAPELDFADRLADPLPVSVRISQTRDLASGVILTSDGLILTSAHVIAGVDEAQVRLDDGRRFSGRVVGVDRRTDVGLMKIDATGLPPALIGDSAGIAPGDWVAAIGAPFGFHGSVTAGVVSAIDRYVAGGGEVPYIQTDVAINPGSSGSPLFNSRGEVVGINSMIYSGSGGYMGLSFAVPINLAMRIAGQLKSSGRVQRARIGADFQEMTPALAQSFGLKQPAGALVVGVDPNGPARSAGLLRGDVVTAFDGKPITRSTELQQRISQGRAGSRNAMEVWRRGATRTLWVTLSEEAAPRSILRPTAAVEWGDGLGLSLGELSSTQRLQLGIDGGLVVREAAGAARSEGIRAGDLIVAVNDTRIDHIEDFQRTLSTIAPGRSVALLVWRDRRLAYVPVRLPERALKPAS
ncbi:trypsin-like peptidase domain-containing protein [Variovorax sp. Sphag1AA]|uniref:trypsin-like peptidase domain-containing protein n=1 Tax=Variovorax sp. Sphag1AA TaxID=2587027 RepID=UPI001612E750|nr:trypsin-like peptidase domain-containing protein [Variovorax sp. Sphag1AA]MBB3176837.1 serine protease Do [Variovorax sp. Sphag1AA]